MSSISLGLVWSSSGNSSFTTVYTAHQGALYSIAQLNNENKLWRFIEPSQYTGKFTTDWEYVGDAYFGGVHTVNCRSMVSHNGQLYAFNPLDLSLYRRGKIGPDTGDDWTKVSTATQLTGTSSFASHQGKLYAIFNNKLYRCDDIDSGTAQIWADVGDASWTAFNPDTNQNTNQTPNGFAPYNGDLYALCVDKLWKRGKIGAGTGNDWAAFGDTVSYGGLTTYNGYCRSNKVSSPRSWMNGTPQLQPSHLVEFKPGYITENQLEPNEQTWYEVVVINISDSLVLQNILIGINYDAAAFAAKGITLGVGPAESPEISLLGPLNPGQAGTFKFLISTSNATPGSYTLGLYLKNLDVSLSSSHVGGYTDDGQQFTVVSSR